MISLIRGYLFNDKKKTFFYIMIIAVAIAMNLLSTGFIVGLKETIKTSAELRYGSFNFALKKPHKNVLQNLQEDPLIDQISSEYIIGDYHENNENTVIIFRDSKFSEIIGNFDKLQEGKFPVLHNEVVVDHKFAEHHNLKVGSPITFDYTNSQGVSNRFEGTISGIAFNNAETYKTNIILTSEAFAKNLLQENQVNETLIKLKDYKDMDLVLDEIYPKGNRNDNLYINTGYNRMLQKIEDLNKINLLTGLLIAIIFFVVIYVSLSGYLNQILVEIATLLSVGFQKKFIITFVIVLLSVLLFFSILPAFGIYYLLNFLFKHIGFNLGEMNLLSMLLRIILFEIVLILPMIVLYLQMVLKLNPLEIGGSKTFKRKNRKYIKDFDLKKYTILKYKMNIKKNISIIVIAIICFTFMGFLLNTSSALNREGFDFVKRYIPHDIVIETKDIEKTENNDKISIFDRSLLQKMNNIQGIEKIESHLISYDFIFVRTNSQRKKVAELSLEGYQSRKIDNVEYMSHSITLYGYEKLLDKYNIENAIILEKNLVDSLKLKTGEKIYLFNQNNDKYMEFILVDSIDEFPFNMRTLSATQGIVTNKALMKLIGIEGYNRFDIKLQNEADVKIKSQLENIPEIKTYGYVQDYDSEIAQREEQRTKEFNLQMSIFVVFMIITIMTIVNMINENVISRVDEFNLLYAIGFTKKEITKSMLIENLKNAYIIIPSVVLLLFLNLFFGPKNNTIKSTMDYVSIFMIGLFVYSIFYFIGKIITRYHIKDHIDD